MIKTLLNTSDKEYRAFILGWVSGIFFALTITQILSFKFINNKINYFQRTKLLNGGLNCFYFDTDINSKSIDNFKDFMNNLEGTEPIYLFFSTNGGSFSVVQMICDIILKYPGETNAIILNKSFSAGTLAVLCCSNIYMHLYAHLSPVDAILSSFFDSTQLSSIKTVLDSKNLDRINDQTLILADQASKCKKILESIFDKICVKHKLIDENKKNVWDDIFGGEKYVHSTTFSVEHLESLGLKIKPITKELIRLAKLANKN